MSLNCEGPKTIELPAEALLGGLRLDESWVDQATPCSPKKIMLPPGAMAWGARSEVADMGSPCVFDRLPPHSPPPALPPSVQLSLRALLPPSPPSSPPSLFSTPMPAPLSPSMASLPSPAPGSTPLYLAQESLHLDVYRDLGTGAAACAGTPETPQKVELPIRFPRWECGGPAPLAAGGNALGSREVSTSRSSVLPGTQGEAEPGLQFPPGLEPAQRLPSVGSALHMAGKCRPCPWFWRPQGCQNGQSCEHCHLCPVGEIKARKKVKQIIMRLGLSTPKTAPGQKQDAAAAVMPAVAEQGTLAGSRASSEREASTSACSDQDQESTTGPCSDSGAAVGSEHAAHSEQEDSSEPVSSPPSQPSNSPMSPPPGLELAQGAPNQGSALHGSGDCHPCAWFWKPIGCQNGQDCAHCHVCPVGALKARKKYKRALLRVGLNTPKPDAAAESQAKYAISLASLI